MHSAPAPPGFPHQGAQARVRQALAGFREGDLHARLGMRGWQDFLRMGRQELLARTAALGPPLDVLVQLFRAGLPVDATVVEAAVGAEALDALCASGLVDRDGSRVRPLVALSLVEHLVFASDLHDLHRSHAADFVLGAGGVTRRLAGFMLRAPVASALDLGCGAGILAGLSAAHAERVLATDVNPRAVAFSRFNAELNGLAHMECREGSLFEPVRGERFDLIVCNPPYVISPTSAYVYRDGGTELCRAVVRGAAEHLTPVGTLQMLVEWPERRGRDWREEVSAWLEGAGCDAWLLRLYSERAEAYATRWLSQEHDQIPEDAYRAWMEHLRAVGAASVGGGLLVLRPARGAQVHLTLRQAPPILEPAGPSLQRWLGCQQLLGRISSDAELLDMVLAPPPELVRVDRHLPTGEGWADDATELRLRTGLAFGARVDPVAAEIVGLLDGRRTPRQALDVVARRVGMSPETFEGGLPGALRRLVALGLLVRVGGGGAPAARPAR